MDYQDLARDLNRRVSALYPDWRNLMIWDSKTEPSIVDLTYSAVLIAIRDAPVTWTAVEVTGAESRDTTAFTLTFWTSDLVVQAVRTPGELHPVVSIAKRSQLHGIEVLSTPLLTTSSWGYHSEGLAVRLTYPTFSATLHDRQGDKLIEALPSFVAEL